MKRSGAVSVGLFLAFVLVTVSLFRDANNDGLVTQFSLGVHALCLSVTGLGLYFVRARSDTREFWPEDLDDVWPDDPETGVEGQAAPEEAWCPEKGVHAAHLFEFAGDTFRCPGKDTFVPAEVIQPTEVLPPVDVEVDLTGQAPVPCTNRRFHAAHDGCPGKTGKRKAAST